MIKKWIYMVGFIKSLTYSFTHSLTHSLTHLFTQLGWNPRQIAELAQNRQIQELIVRNQMTEKMPIIRKLPSAPWHNQLWDEVVGGYQNLRVEAKQAIVNEENMKIEVFDHSFNYALNSSLTFFIRFKDCLSNSRKNAKRGKDKKK